MSIEDELREALKAALDRKRTASICAAHYDTTQDAVVAGLSTGATVAAAGEILAELLPPDVIEALEWHYTTSKGDPNSPPDAEQRRARALTVRAWLRRLGVKMGLDVSGEEPSTPDEIGPGIKTKDREKSVRVSILQGHKGPSALAPAMATTTGPVSAVPPPTKLVSMDNRTPDDVAEQIDALREEIRVDNDGRGVLKPGQTWRDLIEDGRE